MKRLSLFAVIWVLLIFTTICWSASIVNFDKTITAGDRSITIAPPAGKGWKILHGSFDAGPLPGRWLGARLTTVPAKDDLSVTIGVWELSDAHIQFRDITIPAGHQLIFYISGIEEGEIIDTYTRVEVEAISEKSGM